MPRLYVLFACLLLTAPALTAVGAELHNRPHRAEYDEARYYAHQGEWFDALVRLDAPQVRSGGSAPKGPARLPGLLAGDFALSYRMDQRAEAALRAVIDGPVPEAVRNEALFRLAQMYFRNGRTKEALQAVRRIRGSVPAAIRADLAFLRANIALDSGRPAEAVAILKDLQGEKSLEGFSAYNLGIALLRSGSEQQGREQLDRAGRIDSSDRAAMAIRDKANLVLGERLLGEQDFQAAKKVLDRVRLSGPFSNRSLLSSGWADASQEQFGNALVPWSILAERRAADPAVQEALLAVPYAYGRLGVYSTAAGKYEAALQAFGGEIARLDASLAGIGQGALLSSLAQVEAARDVDWMVNLRERPEAFYLVDLMASGEFQESVNNYLDLEQLRKKLDAWAGDLAAFEDILRLRSAYYEPLLPAIDREFRQLDGQVRLRSEQRNRIAGQLEAMERAPRPDLLMTADERAMSEQVAGWERMMTPERRKITPQLWHRIRRLRGALVWNIHADYDRRFAAARAHLRELDHELGMLIEQRRSFEQTRQAVAGSYQGHGDAMGRLRQRIHTAQGTVRTLSARQGQMLESMAVKELTRRRDRLEELRLKARFALADSYDRAGKAGVRGKGAQ